MDISYDGITSNLEEALSALERLGRQLNIPDVVSNHAYLREGDVRDVFRSAYEIYRGLPSDNPIRKRYNSGYMESALEAIEQGDITTSLN